MSDKLLAAGFKQGIVEPKERNAQIEGKDRPTDHAWQGPLLSVPILLRTRETDSAAWTWALKRWKPELVAESGRKRVAREVISLRNASEGGRDISFPAQVALLDTQETRHAAVLRTLRAIGVEVDPIDGRPLQTILTGALGTSDIQREFAVRRGRDTRVYTPEMFFGSLVSGTDILSDGDHMNAIRSENRSLDLIYRDLGVSFFPPHARPGLTPGVDVAAQRSEGLLSLVEYTVGQLVSLSDRERRRRLDDLLLRVFEPRELNMFGLDLIHTGVSDSPQRLAAIREAIQWHINMNKPKPAFKRAVAKWLADLIWLRQKYWVPRKHWHRYPGLASWDSSDG